MSPDGTGHGLYRYTAFTTSPEGGNPAGVWIGESLPPAEEMQRIAAEVGYSETAFLAPAGDGAWTLRYYSTEAEVSFCGHATIASGVVLGALFGPRELVLRTAVGSVPVGVRAGADGRLVATLHSVEPRTRPVEPRLLGSALRLLGWSPSDLDPALPPANAYAGAWHLVIAVESRDVLASLDYDFEGMKELMLEHDLTTLQLVWRERPAVFHARDPFPVGGVVEDPATGAAAAAFGGYLRSHRLVEPPTEIVIHQGYDLGRPSTLVVHIPESGGIDVSGSAVEIEVSG